MAKEHTLDDVINSIVDNYQSLLIDAVAHVAEQAKEDIKNKAINVLYKYYYGKYEPKSYDRIYALEHSIVPFSAISSKGQKLECVVGVEYSPSVLEEYLDMLSGSPYKASKKYGRADADWVIENFWEGRHGFDKNDSASPERYARVTQDKGMLGTDETGVSLLRYAHTTFPHAVMNYMLVEGSKLF